MLQPVVILHPGTLKHWVKIYLVQLAAMFELGLITHLYHNAIDNYGRIELRPQRGNSRKNFKGAFDPT